MRHASFLAGHKTKKKETRGLRSAARARHIVEDKQAGTKSTLGESGGGATIPINKSETVVWLPKSNSDITANSHGIYGPSMDKPLQFSKTLILYHELGGHGFYGTGNAQRTVDYEDLVRTNMGLPLRGTHDAGYYRDSVTPPKNRAI